MTEPHSHPTPSYRGRGRGRGRSHAVRAHVARLAQQRKAANGRRGRQKLYDHPKPQAASERLKELKAAFSAVASALRPALEDLAERNLDRLKSDFNSHREVKEYQDVQGFLDNRHRDMIAHYDNRLTLDSRLNQYCFEKARDITLDSFARDCEDATDRFVEAQLIRLETLEQLHDHGLPIEIIDDSYNFKEIDDAKFKEVKAHLEFRTDLGDHPIYGNKVEVPCAKTVTGRKVVPDVVEETTGKQTAKRKAEIDPVEILPPRKRLAGPADTYSAPTHIGGLLSGVLPPSEEEDGDQAAADTKALSPTPALVEAEADGDADADADADADGDDEELDEDETGQPVYRQVDQEKLPPIPNGASEPDAFGVRLVNKRRTANLDVYNRIMVPSIYDFEPHEIGFRDSANDKSRGATKAKRGKYLNTPNSNTMHFDRSLWQYDATTYADGELDEEMVKKHALHPKYGIFIRSSINEQEPPKERKAGNRPVVFFTPGGRTLNASRSNKIARLENESEAAAHKPAVFSALDQFLQQEGIDKTDVRPSDEAVEEYREKKLKMWIGPRRPSRDATEDEEGRGVGRASTRAAAAAARREEQLKKQQLLEQQQEAEEAEDYDMAFAASQSLGALLEAAAAVEDGQASEAYGASSSMGPAPTPAPSTPPQQPSRRSMSSRPFDPVRDVFLDQSPPEKHSRQGSQDNSASLAATPYADASNLLYIASLASDQEYIPTYPYPQQSLRHLPPRAPPLVQQQQHHSMMPHEAGPAGEYPPRRMSMDYPQNAYHSHHLHQQPPHHHHPHDSPLLDPRLFGGDAPHQQQQQMHPEAIHNPASNGYGGSYYQQQQQQLQQQQQHQHAHSFLHTALNQAMPLHAQHQQQQQQQQDPYGQAPLPPPNVAYGPVTMQPPPPPPGNASSHGMPPLDASPTSRRPSSQYYMSPPPQSQQPLSQSQPQHSHTLPMLRPYQSGYGSQPPPPPPPPSRLQTSSYQPGPLMQSMPPLQQQQQPRQLSPPPMYHTSNGPNDQQFPPPQSVAGSSGSPPPDGQQPQTPGSGNSNNNKYRKLEPAPLPPSRGSWPSDGTSGSGSNSGSNANNSSNNGTASSNVSGINAASNNPSASSTPLATSASSMGGGNGGSNATNPNSNSNANTPSAAPKELRTVPYDYEKIKDYVAVEPPPSHGPKAIRGWAHNNMKRSKAGAKPEVASEWEKEDK